MSGTTLDRVLSVPPPAFSPAEAAAIARQLFGVDGPARPAGSERDQAFFIDGNRPAVLKISNTGEDPARLDMEWLAARRVAALEPDLPVALSWPVGGSSAGESDDPAAYRAVVRGTDGSHLVRLYDRLPGRPSVRGADLDDDAVRDWATMAARLGRALRGFSHPAAVRVMPWDVQHALRLRDMLGAVADPAERGLVSRALDRYASVVTPAWPRLRAQVIHGDLCADNVLVGERGEVTGIIDFGDMGFSALIADLVPVVESHVTGRTGDDILRTARIALDGYARVTPLEQAERVIFGELLAARACASVVVPAFRAAMYDDGDALMADLRREAVGLLEHLERIGFDAVSRQLGGDDGSRPASTAALAARRGSVLGPALTQLSYREPLHLVRGEGVWLRDVDGRRYLDAYNNVPVVGHGHPRVTEAIAEQGRRLNTNLRYLHPTVLEVAERLIAATPPELDVVLFVNSGSEANDLAWRLAVAATGHTGGLCTENAYHGITEAVAALSPESRGGPAAGHVRTWAPAGGSNAFAAAVDELERAGHSLAASILDGVLTSDGILELDPLVAPDAVRRTHDAGGMWIADEVQGGHGRTGMMWSFERLGINPDIVTLGKPMGNGHPVAAVITRRDIAEPFAATTDFFSTFGGNPVAMATALAVLDVLEDERLVDNARSTGEHLRRRLRAATSGAALVREVRGMGLATGVEIVRPPSSAPDAATAGEIVEGLRERGVLVGTTGPAGNVLKIRPPLVFRPAHADLLADAFAETLATLRS
jgi:4-aminobutyrate aminotransferase-like enzyme/Ser/Thr protein kinase RdoA (MazF antagonist)